MSQKGRMFYAYSQTVAFEIIGAADLNVSRINNLHVFFMFKAIGHTFNVLKSTKQDKIFALKLVMRDLNKSVIFALIIKVLIFCV